MTIESRVRLQSCPSSRLSSPSALETTTRRVGIQQLHHEDATSPLNLAVPGPRTLGPALGPVGARTSFRAESYSDRSHKNPGPGGGGFLSTESSILVANSFGLVATLLIRPYPGASQLNRVVARPTRAKVISQPTQPLALLRVSPDHQTPPATDLPQMPGIFPPAARSTPPASHALYFTKRIQT
jgi:hypothetical protein